MQIVLISYHTCPLAAEEGKETGGMNVYVAESALALGALGHQVDIFTRSQDPSNEPVVQLSKNVRLFHLVAGPEAEIDKKELDAYLETFVEEYFVVAERWSIAPDIIHAHYYYSGLIGRSICDRYVQLEQKTPPLVMQFHTLAVIKDLVARSASEYSTQFRHDAEKKLVEQADLIISPSSFDRMYLLTLLSAQADKVTVLPPGFNDHLFHPIHREQARQNIGAPQLPHPLLMYVGRIEPLKGIDSILYALKIYQSKYPQRPQPTFFIVGGDVTQPRELWSQELQRIDRLRHQLLLNNSVKIVGQKKQSELVHYYNAADVLIMPSHYESFGMASLEALACGTPVILSNVTGIASMLDIPKQSMITTVNNPLMLAENIYEVLSHSRDDLMDSLNEKIAELTWSSLAQKLVYEFQSLLE